LALPFFRSKKDVVEFTQNFYNTYLFSSGPIDAVSAYAEVAYRNIREADPSLGSVLPSKLKDEMLGLQLEMIGTAWTHKSKESAAIGNSEFTQFYLVNRSRSDLWEVMGDYNQVVAASATHGADPSTTGGRGRIAFINSMRADLFDSWIAKGHDGEAVARVVNRLGSQSYWHKGVTPMLLGIRMMTRLEFKGSQGVAEKLAAIAFGFYQGAKESVDGVKLTA
jgi:hypothetical protein